MEQVIAARFKTLRLTIDESSWQSAFDYLHEKWDDRLGKDFIDKVWDHHVIFKSPRDVERKYFEEIWGIKNGDDAMFDAEDLDVEDYLEDVVECMKQLPENDPRTAEFDKHAEKLAQLAYEWVNSTGEEKTKKKRSKGKDMISDELRNIITNGMSQGYLHVKDPMGDGKDVDFGVSRENIFTIVSDGTINREQLNRLLNELEKEGYTFKYETDQEWKDAGYADASAPEYRTDGE